MFRKCFIVTSLLLSLSVRADGFESILALTSGNSDPTPVSTTVLAGLDVPAIADPGRGALQSAAVRPVAFSSVDAQAFSHASDLHLSSASALVIDQDKGQLMYGKNIHAIQPIASITKLMTAIVVLDAKLKLDQKIRISELDVDLLKGTRSRLRVGTLLTRRELLKLALMASENRAASALGRVYPGGADAFIDAMNRKAVALGMRETRFMDSSGLNPGNVSTAQDLAILVNASYQYPLIRHFSTSESYEIASVATVKRHRARAIEFRNSNGLVRAGSWDIGLSKTGYISEAGRCLVMQATIGARPVIIVLLDSWGKMTRLGDANRVKRWIEGLPPAGRGYRNTIG
ncbi:MAG: D-alanyl-D-alanine endopeptidase [Betaproteobacteria bacterium]|nr:D-alanyl-D-alanine endopeptidase [Betaproteobacteria bacterium]